MCFIGTHRFVAQRQNACPNFARLNIGLLYELSIVNGSINEVIFKYATNYVKYILQINSMFVIL
ncbi:MAG: hypothetical protein ACD_62C00227G0003 [uncultured bacterium]|nr:MAG: hypothetical protein ACD_62C00227G0003 [uncultured bacterium]